MTMKRIRGAIVRWEISGLNLNTSQDFKDLSQLQGGALASVWEAFLDHFIPELFEQRTRFIKKHNAQSCHTCKMTFDDESFKGEMTDILRQQLQFHRAPSLLSECSSVDTPRSLSVGSSSKSTCVLSQNPTDNTELLSSVQLSQNPADGDETGSETSAATSSSTRKPRRIFISRKGIAEQEGELAIILSGDFDRKRYHEFPRVKILEEETKKARIARIKASTFDASTWVRLPQDLTVKLPDGTVLVQEVALAARMPNMPFERLMDVLFGLIGDKPEGPQKIIGDEEKSFEHDQLSLYFSLLRGNVKNKAGKQVTAEDTKAHEGMVDRIMTAYALMVESSRYIVESIEAASDLISKNMRKDVKVSFESLVKAALPELKEIVDNLDLEVALKEQLEAAASNAQKIMEAVLGKNKDRPQNYDLYSAALFVKSNKAVDPLANSPKPYQDVILGLDALIEDIDPLNSPAAESWEHTVAAVKPKSAIFSPVPPTEISALTHEFLKKLMNFIHKAKDVDAEGSRTLMSAFIARFKVCFDMNTLKQGNSMKGSIKMSAFFTDSFKNASGKKYVSLKGYFNNMISEASGEDKTTLQAMFGEINPLMEVKASKKENMALTENSARTFYTVVNSAAASLNRMRKFFTEGEVENATFYDSEEERYAYQSGLPSLGA